jgi:NAD(P)-dependent dehydrogenase (short-subunit alcohol dehydrogenase family)
MDGSSASHSDPFGLEGRRVLVTGASAGIGRAVSVHLAGLGARLVLAGRNRGQLDATLASCPGTGHVCSVFDLADLAGIPAWVKGLAAEAGPIYGLVHCAGVQLVKSLRAMSESDLGPLFTTNVHSGLLLAKAIRQRKVRDEQVSLVFISSVMGQVGSPGRSAYCATKGAVEAMVRALALELAPEGIRVNGVAPGFLRTAMFDDLSKMLTQEQIATIESQHPLGLGTPEQVASVIAFLLGSPSSWVTGTTLVVDGGYTAR